MNRPGITIVIVMMLLFVSAGCITDNRSSISIEPSTTYAKAPAQIIFNSSIGNLDETRCNFSWDLGDGTTKDGRSLTYIYATPGEYNVTLTVTDDKGVKTQASVLVTVIVNMPPHTTATVSVNYGKIPLSVRFDATTEDYDGEIVEKYWDFGDGVTTDEFGALHVYTSAGTYIASFNVQEDSGRITSQNFTITAQENLPPVIHNITASVDKLLLSPSSAVTFEANVTDYDGEIVSYEWDVDESMPWRFMVSNTTGHNMTHRFVGGNVHVVTLMVTDNDGATDKSFMLFSSGFSIPDTIYTMFTNQLFEFAMNQVSELLCNFLYEPLYNFLSPLLEQYDLLQVLWDYIWGEQAPTTA